MSQGEVVFRKRIWVSIRFLLVAPLFLYAAWEVARRPGDFDLPIDLPDPVLRALNVVLLCIGVWQFLQVAWDLAFRRNIVELSEVGIRNHIDWTLTSTRTRFVRWDDVVSYRIRATRLFGWKLKESLGLELKRGRRMWVTRNWFTDGDWAEFVRLVGSRIGRAG